MSEFAQVNAEGIVLQVILADQDSIAAGHAGEPARWFPVIPQGSAGIGYARDPATGGYAAPVAPLSAAAAKAELHGLIAAATAPILDAYPEAERLAWDAKEAEALAFQVAVDPVLSHYALLRGEIAAEMAIAASEVTAEQMAAKAAAVLWLAASFRSLVSALSGIRKRFELAIDAAEDDASRRAELKTSQATISGAA